MATLFRVLQVHNEYYSGYGGEDTVAALEAGLLRQHGHQVERLIVSTTELKGASLFSLASAALGTIWSVRGYTALRKAVAGFAPDVIHVHNTFPLLSPSIFWAAGKANVPVVQTLHNFRMACANALLLRDGVPCQSCVGHIPWPALRYRCYRGSRTQTAILTAMNTVHRRFGTYTKRVDAHIALADFSKAILVRSGLPEDRIFVKPNFIPAQCEPGKSRKPQLIFVGRISREKGIHLLLQAWNLARNTGRMPSENRLVVIGEGPDRVRLEEQFGADSAVVWCGTEPNERVMDAIASSRLLSLPSLCYENCPMVLLEAFSVGTPVIVPDHGPFPGMVSHEKNGLLFSWGDVPSLAAALSGGMSASPNIWSSWSCAARSKYLANYTEQLNYERLLGIYRQAIERFQLAHPKLVMREA